MSKLFRHFIFLALISLSLVSLGQTNYIVKNLLDSSSLTKNSRIVILIQTDTFMVLTINKLFIKDCKEFIKEHGIDWDKDLLQLFINDKSKVIYADSVTKTTMNKSRLIFRMSDLLETGNCLVYNKMTKQLEKSILIERYMTKYVVGRKFKTQNKLLILETVDGVF